MLGTQERLRGCKFCRQVSDKDLDPISQAFFDRITDANRYGDLRARERLRKR